MEPLLHKLHEATQHLVILDKTFKNKRNYESEIDFIIYEENSKRFEELANDDTIKKATLTIRKGLTKKVKVSFADEIYHQAERQMKISDLIEYLFLSRGIYFLFQGNSFKQDRVSILIELILRYVNLLMMYESLTVDKKLRGACLSNLDTILKQEYGYKELKSWKENVGLPKQKKRAPSEYFDSLLPKTAGGLWHEMLVFAFILRYDIGHIFSLLLNQKPISLTGKLSPPDLIILHKKTCRYYGIEIGNLKERQSGGFMSPSGIPVIPIDTQNSRISDRCPICSRWINICPKVIKDFSATPTSGDKAEDPCDEIRCLIYCDNFTLDEKINGKCPYMKFSYQRKINGDSFNFADNKHYHYHCCIKKDRRIIDAIKRDKNYKDLLELDKATHDNSSKDEITKLKGTLQNKFVYIKTHSVFYSELIKLIKMNH